MTARSYRWTAVLLAAALLMTGAPALSQTQGPLKVERGPNYSKGKANPLGVYFPISVPEPVLANSPRVEQLLKEGKLQLSLKDAIALALENNLDISVQRYVPWIADTDILRAKSGGATRGLAGTGTASVLGSIPAQSFDPVYTSTFSWDRRSIPVNNPLTAGVGTAFTQPALTNYTMQWNNQVSQSFHTGTGYAITWNNTRSSTTSPAAFLNPSVQSTLFFSFSQQLLNGFGLLPNTRFILMAKNSKRIADLAFAQQVITTISSVENQYWDLVFAREDLKVKQRSVELAEKLYNDNKRQVEIGTLAPIEVVRAESEVARARQDLIVAQTALLQQQTLLKNSLSKNPATANLLGVEIVPTETISKPPATDLGTLEQSVKEAWQKRVELRQAQVDLENRNINIKATRNALLPTLSLFGQFGGTGLAGNSTIPGSVIPGSFTPNLNSPIVDATGTPTGNFTSTAVRNASTFQAAGWGDALGVARNFSFPTYSVQLSLNVPILNRSAQADNARALLEQRQAETSLQRLQNSIVVEVRNAQIGLEQSRARVEAAIKSRILFEQTLDAEQKKYQLGASTIFFVIQAQRDLAQAQSTEVSALVALTKAQVEYDRSLGRTLEVNNITIGQAKIPNEIRDLNIPGAPSAEILAERAKF